MVLMGLFDKREKQSWHKPLKGQSDGIFDLYFFSSKDSTWASHEHRLKPFRELFRFRKDIRKSCVRVVSQNLHSIVCVVIAVSASSTTTRTHNDREFLRENINNFAKPFLPVHIGPK